MRASPPTRIQRTANQAPSKRAAALAMVRFKRSQPRTSVSQIEAPAASQTSSALDGLSSPMLNSKVARPARVARLI